MMHRFVARARGELEALFASELCARLFATLLLLGLVYRTDLYSFTFTDRIGPFALNVDALRVFRHTLTEPLFAAVVCLASFVGLRVLTALAPGRAQLLMEGGIAAVLLVVGFIYGLQRHLLDALNVGLTHELLVEGLGSTPMSEVLRQMEVLDLAYTLGPLAAFWGQHGLAERGRRVRDGFILLALSSLLGVGLWGRDARPLPPSARAMVTAPVWFVASDVFDQWGSSSQRHFPRADAWGKAQNGKLRLDDRAFGRLTVSEASPPQGVCGERPCSVLVVIMESVGTRYVFDKRKTGESPMPNLERWSQQGWWLSRHHSTNNSSPHSIFSILTGLYPLPAPRMFSTTNRVHVPSLFSLLPEQYDSFFYSAGPLKWYFPYGLLQHSGVDEIVDEETIQGKRERTPTAANEIDATDAFIARLERAKPPFVGVYYSYVPHFPYRDYGSEYEVMPDTSRRIDRYINNLRLLDTQLARIVAAAKRRVPEQELVILLTGDHGEAFGQHRGNWVHLTYSYEENFETPAILLHPTLFAGRVEKRLTGHVDLLPTLLDAVGATYDPQLFQGVSLLRPGWQREYYYLYGNENAVSSISKDGKKVSANFKTGRTRLFDLAQDPRERFPRRVDAGDPQLEALLQYQRFQLDALPRYNDSALRHEPFAGRSHRHR